MICIKRLKKIEKISIFLGVYFVYQAVPVMAQQWDQNMANIAFEFCERYGYFMTEAYIESKEYVSAICSNASPEFDHETQPCYEPSKYFIVVKPITNNKILTLPTWPKESKDDFPKKTYTFESTLNGITYQIRTTGGSNNYQPDVTFWTSMSLKKQNKIIYSHRVNYYYGSIGMGC